MAGCFIGAVGGLELLLGDDISGLDVKGVFDVINRFQLKQVTKSIEFGVPPAPVVVAHRWQNLCRILDQLFSAVGADQLAAVVKGDREMILG